MKKVKMKKSGISLVALAITIIVILILAAAIILTVSVNSPISEANEAVIRSDIKTMQDTYKIVYSAALLENNAKKDQIEDSDLEEAIPDKYKNDFMATTDGIVYIGSDEFVEKIAEEMGIIIDGFNVIRNVALDAGQTSIDVEVTIAENIVVEEYIYQIREKGKETWEEFTSTENKLIIENLKENTSYEVKVVAKQGETTHESKIKTAKTSNVQMGTLILKLNDVYGKEYMVDTWAAGNIYVAVEGANTSYSVTGANQVADRTSATTLTNEGISKITLKNTSGSTIKTEEYTVKIDKSTAEISSLVSSNESPTNFAITLTGKAKDTLSGIIAYQFSTSESITASSSGWKELTTEQTEITEEYTVSENGTYYFYVKDVAGNVAKEEIIVDNYDITAPTNTAPTLTSTTNSITVTFKQTDESGIKNETIAYAIKKTSDTTWGAWKVVNNTTYTFEKLDKDTEYEVKTKVTDAAGNTSESVAAKISTVNITKPTIEASSEWVSKEVKVTITYPEIPGTTRQYSTNGENWTNVTGLVQKVTVSTNNTTVYARLIDSTEQTSGNASWQVTCIDSTAPKINSFTKSTQDPTNQAITLTGKGVDEESGIVAYMFSTADNLTAESAGWKEITSTKTEITQTYSVSENDTYYFYVKNDADLVTKEKVEVGNIDKTAPTLESINVTSPATGTYAAGQKVTITATFSENIVGTVPALKIKFGSGSEKSITTGTINGNAIIYTYEIVAIDAGVLASVSYSGGSITDSVGNTVVLENKTLGGNKITASTESIIQSWTETSATDFHAESYRTKITKIVFKNNLTVPSNATYWDVSEAGNGSVMAYVEDDGNSGYMLTIAGNNKVYANIDSSYLLYNFTALKEIENINLFDTSRTTNMMGMFAMCSSLTSLDLSSFNTSNVTNMYEIFMRCSSLVNLNLKSFNTSKVTDMSRMFLRCSSLNSLDLSSFNTSNVILMSDMFAVCSNLISIDLSNFDTSNVTDMWHMFNGCSSLTSLNLSSFNTSKVTDMRNMFYNCSSLKTLDLSSFDTSKVTDSDPEDKYGGIDYMFKGMISLEQVVLGEKFSFLGDGTLLSEYQYLPTPSAEYIEGADGKWYSKSTGKAYTSKSIPNNVADTYSAIPTSTTLVKGSTFKDNIPDIATSIVFTDTLAPANAILTDVSEAQDMGVVAWLDGVTYKVSTQRTSMKILANSNSSNMLQEHVNLTSIDFSNLDTSNVTNMGNMFNGCTGLTSIDISKLDTSKVKVMIYMFANCSSLKDINASNFNTSQVTRMNHMFINCSSLESVNISSFNTSNVTDMTSMFANCTKLAKLDISNFETGKVTNMTSMFKNCPKLKSLNISGFNTSNVTTMTEIFHDSARLAEITLGDKFAFVGTDGYLPIPSSYYISGADGNWYNTAGVAYVPEKVPNNVADTYYATSPDSIKPTISAPTELKKGSVDVTITYPSIEGATFEYSTDGTKWNTATEITHVVTVSENNTTVYARVTNSNGQVSNVASWEVTNLDNDAPTLSSINVTSPATGTYAAKQVVTIVATFSENIVGTVPTLKIKFGSGSDKTISSGTIKDNTITYTYEIVAEDSGVLATTGYSGGSLKDSVGNNALLENKTLGGNKITASTESIIQSWTKESATDFHAESYRTKITKIVFKNNLTVPSNVTSWDVSSAQNGSVMAYVEDNGNSGYVLTIAGNGKVYANADSSYMFYNFTTLTTFENMALLDTSKTTNMRHMISKCSNLTSIDVTGFDTSQVTDMYAMFYNCKVLTDVDVSKFDISNVADMAYMFEECNALPTVNVSNWDTSNVQYINGLFYHCYNLKTVDVSKFNTSNVIDMHTMFSGCNSLTSIDVSNFNTSKVTNMRSMFYDCKLLTNIDVSKFDTSKVTDMSGMFCHCSALTSIDVSNFNTSQVIDMHYMFLDCSSLTSLDVSKFDTSNVTDMRSMFNRCSGLTSIDVSKFDTNKVTNMYAMFNKCNNITELDLSSFDTSKVIDIDSTEENYGIVDFFYGMNKLEKVILGEKFSFLGDGTCTAGYLPTPSSAYIPGADGKWYSITNGRGYAPSEIPNNTADTYSAIPFSTNLITGSNFKATIPDTATSVIFTDIVAPSNTTLIDVSEAKDMGVVAWLDGTTYNISTQRSGVEILANANSSYMFKDKTKLENIDFSNFNTSNTTQMYEMFYKTGADAITFNADLSKWNTSNVVSMCKMFNNSGLNATTWNVGNLNTKTITKTDSSTYTAWDTSKVTNMNGMFGNTGFKATTWNIGELSNWDITNVKDISGMFVNAGYYATTWDIGDLSKWNTSSVTTMESTFYATGYKASSFDIGNLKNWDTSSVTNMSHMFFSSGKNATTWNIGDLNNWNTSSVTDMSNMFSNAGYKATTWSIGDLSNWDVSLVENLNGMFDSAGCNASKFDIGDIDKWNISKVTTMRNLFAYAGFNATTWNIGDLNNWDTSKVTDMYRMFSHAGSMTTTWSIGDLSKWNTSLVTNMSYMFSYTGYKTTTFDIGNLNDWDTSKVTDMSYMFNNAGYHSITWNIGALNKWNTSSVTQMNSMFDNTGVSATTWNIGNLDNWNTAKVTSMAGMFYYAGMTATTWNIGDLSKWDTSKVTDMSYMFNNAATKATSWNIGNLNNWIISSVTNTSYMFDNAGVSATTWNIGDLSNWNTSSVTDMSNMFSYAGYKATTWSIGDLSNWDTSSVTNMYRMFSHAGYNTPTWSIGNLKSWNTSKVTNMTYMFSYAGNKATTFNFGDLSNWNTSQVKNMSYMFGNCLKLKSLNLSNWDTSSVTDMSGIFHACVELQQVTLGSKFSFLGDGTCVDGYLPTPSSEYIPGAKGVWYNTAGVAYIPSEIPNNVADTYYAVTANKPILPSGATPVKWINNVETNTTIDDVDWYNYTVQTSATTTGGTSKWANCKLADGSYFVWIPRYAYKIDSTNQTIDVKFTKYENGTDVAYDGSSLDGYIVHPAFKNDVVAGGWDSQLTGIWVAKYEAATPNSNSQTGDTVTASSVSGYNMPVFKPNRSSYENISVGDAYQIAKEYNTTSNSHMLKNSEWGAVAYLAQSQYGRNGTEITINNSKITGNAGDEISDANYNISVITNEYNTDDGVLASTTGNIYGIYDLSGGVWERTAGYVNYDGKLDSGTALVNDGDAATSNKYKTVYSYNKTTNSMDDNYSMPENIIRVGEAIWETSTSASSRSGAWNEDCAYFMYSYNSFITRGGGYDDSVNAGMYAFSCTDGRAYERNGFRVALVVEDEAQSQNISTDDESSNTFNLFSLFNNEEMIEYTKPEEANIVTTVQKDSSGKVTGVYITAADESGISSITILNQSGNVVKEIILNGETEYSELLDITDTGTYTVEVINTLNENQNVSFEI